MRALPRAGRRTMRSSELSNSRESPGLSCNSSRTGLGSTSRPVLSRVRVVTINAILPYYLPSGMPSQTLRTSIVLRISCRCGRPVFDSALAMFYNHFISHYILRRGFMPDEDFQPSEVHPISEVSTGKWVLLLVAIAYVAGSLFLIFNLRGRLDQVSKDQAASSAQIAELTKRMQSAEASDETLAQQVGITKKELASRAAAITRQQ